MLVNAAGYGKVGPVDKGCEEQLGQIDLNCRSLTRMIQLCLPYMGRGSRILNVASAAAFCPQPGFAVYAAAKAYVYSLSLALGEELKERGIAGHCAVSRAGVDTEFFDRSGPLPGKLRGAARATAYQVVRQGLLDAVRGRRVSVYGTSMKAARLGAKLVPDRICAAFLRKINQSGVEEQ